jgi:hypothetical protein
MKNKMIVLFAGLFLLANTGFAQGKTSFSLRAGVNFTNLNGEQPGGGDLNNKLKAGFHVGVEAALPIADEFFIQPGVLFSTKGAKSEADDDVKVNLSYIEVPVTFLYKPMLGTGRLILGVGPYFAWGVSGKLKGDGADQNIKFENKISLAEYADGHYLKSFDAGGNLFFGYEFSQKIFAQLNAQLGMVNIQPKIEGVDDDERGKIKNTGFGVSVGYRF